MNETTVIIPGILRTLVCPARDAFPQQIFEPKDIKILASPTALLNDSLINGCAVLLYLDSLQASPAVQQYAILSTHDLPRIRYNASDDMLWCNISRTKYWAKDVWIIPIHRPSGVGHWVLCIVHLQSKELHLFDSFAEQRPWKSEVKVSTDIVPLSLDLMHLGRHEIDCSAFQHRSATSTCVQSRR
jgi:Ulp1 family protease